MNVTVETLTERQIKFGILKLALLLASTLFLGALIGSFFFQTENKISSVPIYALIFAVAFSVLSNGFLAVLHVFDWFEARRVARGAENG